MKPTAPPHKQTPQSCALKSFTTLSSSVSPLALSSLSPPFILRCSPRSLSYTLRPPLDRWNGRLRAALENSRSNDTKQKPNANAQTRGRRSLTVPKGRLGSSTPTLNFRAQFVIAFSSGDDSKSRRQQNSVMSPKLPHVVPSSSQCRQ